MVSVLLVFLCIKPSIAYANPYDGDLCEELINEVQDELNKKGTTIEQELKKFEDKYNNEKPILDSSLFVGYEINKKQDSLGLMEGYYSNYIPPVNGTKAGYDAAVLAVIAWFNSKDYDLAAELLSHARKNKDNNSSYYPRFGSRVTESATFQSCKHDYSSDTGTAAFEPDKKNNSFC